MSYKFKFLNDGEASTTPDLEPLTGRRPMTVPPVRTVFVAQDAMHTQTRRVMLQVGLHGAENWQIGDTPVAEGVQLRPTRALKRYVGRSPALRLTPGCFLRMTLVALPSGLTMVLDGEGTWVEDGPFGEVGIEVKYRNAGGEESVATATLTPVLSAAANGAQPQGPAAAFGALQRLRTLLLKPPVVIDVPGIEAWCDGVTAEIAVYYRGGPRVLDLVVHEEPYMFAADTEGELWAQPMLTDGSGQSLAGLPSDFPVYQAKIGEVGGGTYVLADAALRQRELGPLLWCYTGRIESEAGLNDAEVAADTFAVSSFFAELVSGVAGYRVDRPGVSVSCGANARVQAFSHHTHVLRDADNVVPVRCWILGKMAMTTPTPSARIRFAAADYSIAEVVVSGTEYAWYSATGHLRCGLGPGDDTVLQLLGRVTAGATLSWRAAFVEYAHLA